MKFFIISLLIACLYIKESIQDSDNVTEVTSNNATFALLGKNPSKDRIWNFAKGKFELIEPSQIKKTQIGSLLGNDYLKRRKRETVAEKLNQPKMMEEAVFVDQYLWDLYVEKYGLGEAEPRLRTFIWIMINETRALYQHPSIAPRLEIEIQKIEIWKYQPDPLRQERMTNALDYIDKFCSFVRPQSSGFDHASLISGIRLQAGPDIDGIAWQDAMCTDSACTLVRGAYNTAYRHGNTLAHEMGHSLGMEHDGTGGSSSCNEDCCIMAPKQTGTVWSDCSVNEYKRTLLETSCLEKNYIPTTSTIMQGPVNLLPGQVMPDEAQCHQIVGTCYRNVPGHEGECDKLYCTKHMDSSILTTVNELRLDGSYCGPGKVCDGGKCGRLDAARQYQMTPANGGWSYWHQSTEEECGAGRCSDCELSGQIPLKLDIRRCDNPYPNNGGAPCLGSQVRGRRCGSGDAIPYTCNSGQYRYSDRMSYMQAVCKRQYNSANTVGVRYEENGGNCEFTCYVGSEQTPKRFPDGVSCGTSSMPGRCVSGICMYQKCSNNQDLFVVGDVDCE